jgi:ATP-dependent helicase/nuclease subunit A
MLGDARGRWLLGPHADAKSEYRVRVATGNSIYSCIMDRVFRDDAGTRRIVDYKTSGHEGGDVEAFLDRERYAGQLARYANSIGDQDPVMLGLYFPLLTGWREWKDKKA